MNKKLPISILFLSVILFISSCKTEGCTDLVAKNFSETAEKDNGSCEFYTNTEFITDSIWKFSTVSSKQVSENDQLTAYYKDATFTFDSSNVTMSFPSSSTGNSVKSWEFSANETFITLEKGTKNENTIDIVELNISNFIFNFKSANSDSIVTVYFIH